jgi:hypothetical protein
VVGTGWDRIRQCRIGQVQYSKNYRKTKNSKTAVRINQKGKTKTRNEKTELKSNQQTNNRGETACKPHFSAAVGKNGITKYKRKDETVQTFSLPTEEASVLISYTAISCADSRRWTRRGRKSWKIGRNHQQQ